MSIKDIQEIGVVTDEPEFGDSWQEIVREIERTDKVPFHGAFYASYGEGDTTFALLEFSEQGSAEALFVVGQGEALRPYIEHYKGSSDSAALRAFFNAIQGKDRLTKEFKKWTKEGGR